MLVDDNMRFIFVCLSATACSSAASARVMLFVTTNLIYLRIFCTVQHS